MDVYWFLPIVTLVFYTIIISYVYMFIQAKHLNDNKILITQSNNILSQLAAIDFYSQYQSLFKMPLLFYILALVIFLCPFLETETYLLVLEWFYVIFIIIYNLSYLIKSYIITLAFFLIAQTFLLTLTLMLLIIFFV